VKLRVLTLNPPASAVILWGNYVEKVAGTGKSMDLNE
jgi:hypothetical protein